MAQAVVLIIMGSASDWPVMQEAAAMLDRLQVAYDVTVSSALLPHSMHLRFNRWRGVDVHDIFPTVYRANTAARLRSLYEAAGLRVERLEQFETEPEYLAFSLPTYALGVAYERVVNRFDALRNLRVNLLAVGRKG